ncbi:hypothetical protein KIW84_024776 [Lathyrus oleraceus]|uniref:Uncharacterized protein n=1 Tax=Pisum sativum TaxID=3888 RepID=A0A9D4YII5_PEA|nr:hypothetical protein KIW84_024776 [Pisum sativum]
MCTSTLPASRPSMKEVLKILIGCRDLQANAEKIVDIYDDAPLLKNLKWEKQVWFDGAPTNEQTVLQGSIVAEILQPELRAAVARRNAELAWL